MKRSNLGHAETDVRIIEAAGAVFAERGFRNTTIRQITARAGVNIAAVNYHFRDKEELYVQVLREAKRHVSWIRIEELDGTPEERFRAFIGRFVGSLLDPERPSWHGRILAMEMANPTPALDVIIKELTAPFYKDARTLVGQVVRGNASPADLDLLTLSVVGQCVFYATSRPMIAKLAVDLGRHPKRLEKIAEHIAEFSLTALHSTRPRTAVKSARTSRVRALSSSNK